jgi:uncharacterized protein YfaS (alpha-2-macroglobulin family)
MHRMMLFTGLLLLMLLTIGGVAAQGEDPIPPQVIDVWPLPGVEMAADDPLTITFNQAMDRASVEAAFSLTPDVAGRFSWADDRTVSFVPVDGWPRAMVLAARLDATAVASNGLTLVEPYTFEVQTIGALVVTAVTPEGGAEGVAADARIVVTFNRPVVPLVSTADLSDLPAPLTIEPTIVGQGEWLNTSIYAFTPQEALKGGTTYRLSVPQGLTTVTGAVLDEPYDWTFSTLAPQILNISPTPNAASVLLDRPITVTFSQPMDHASTEAAFSLLSRGGAVAGAFSWNETSTQLVFQPADMLEIATMYTINVAESALSAAGEAALQAGQTTSFVTVPYPGVQDTSPDNGQRDVRPGRGARIEFRSPMNTDTFEGKVLISPETAWQPSVWGNQSLGIEFAALPNTTYTITLLAGTEDIYGNAITTDYVFSFTTGAIDTWAYPITGNSNLAITGAHRQDTRFSVYVSGTPNINFELYQVPLNDLSQVVRHYYYEDDMPPWVTPANMLRKWSQSFDSEGREGVPKEVLLAAEDGGTLPNGLYWVIMRAPDRQLYQFPLAVSTANLTVKRSQDDLLVWVTDMLSADPVIETTVTVYHNGTAIARGQTGTDGVFRAPVDVADSDEFITIIADGAGAYGVWFNQYAPELPTQQGYLYTDRPLYRPGQTVYFRGVLRDREDMAYSVPNQQSVYVTADSYYGGERLFESQVSVTEYGTFSGEIVLPEDAPIGQAYIQAGMASITFTIAEFRVPEFEVTVTPQEDMIFQGRELNALLETTYYFGGAVSGATLNWSAYGEPTSFQYTGPGRYTFSDATQEYYYHYLGDGMAQTDGSGQFMITTSNTQPASRRPMRVTVEGTVTDESQQAISGRATITAHPANVYVGLRSERYFGRANQPMSIDLIAVTASSDPLADKRVDLRVVETRWTRVPVEGQFGRYTWEREDIEVAVDQVMTGPDGTATYTFTPPNAGIFRVESAALDEYERTNGSTLRFWVMGDRPVWWGEPSQTIDLIADQQSYKPGDVAEILVPLPFAGGSTVLVSIERAGVIDYEVLAVEGSTLLYELPITEAHVPTVHVSVTVVKGIDDESLNPDHRIGDIALDVEPVMQQLTVTLTPSADLTQPRETVDFDVQIIDAQGQPVQAEVGLALTDKAILALMPPNSAPLLDTYYGYQGNYVRTDHSIVALLDRITDEYVGVANEQRGGMEMEETAMEGLMMADGVGGAPAPTAAMASGDMDDAGAAHVTVREEFEQTPLWVGHVVTDAEGRATVSVTLPDNLTTWTLDGRALTMETSVGQATTEIVTTLPLLVRPVAPRFFVVDDRVELAAVVNNNTAEAQVVEVTLQADGVELEDPITQQITIEAGERGKVTWLAVAQDVEYVDLTFVAIGADGYQDATRPTLATGPDGTIPVYRYTAPDTVGTGGVLRDAGSRTEAISLPPRLDADQGDLTVRVDPSLAVTVTDTFDYLKNYPHQCIEQTVSRFLPNVVTYSALRDLGIQDPTLEANLYTVLEEALVKLAAEQNYDGGWGWFSRMESNPLVTAYAALGLIEARDAGFAVDQGMIDRALNFVKQDYIRPQLDTSAWRLNRQAFYFYVLARAGQGDLNAFNALYENRLEMSYQGRAYLLMAYHMLYPAQGAVADLTSDLTTAAILSATGAHWEEASNDWWNWSSDTRTTALVLNALAKVTPDSDLLPNAVRWLMVARQGDHWQTTQENVWAVIALTDWMVLTGELRGNYDYTVSLNRDSLAQTTVTPDTVRDGQTLRVAVKDLLLDEINRLVLVQGEGDGALYYTAHLNLRLPASEADAIDRGVSVTREYFLEDDPNTRISSAEVGDVVTVRLTLTLSQDIYYFVLEDPIPAGTEGVDTSLLTTSQQVEGPDLQRQWDDRYEPFWYWGWWWFDHTEMRDEQVNLYADFLPRGTYVYTYQVRASIAGEFQTMPSHAYAFYFPEVFGRTDGELFTVLPESAE